MSDIKFTEDKAQLKLVPNFHEVLVWKGRIQGQYPIFIPDSTLVEEKMVQQAHKSTLHRRRLGGPTKYRRQRKKEEKHM